MKLIEILREIGDPEKASKPYDLETYSDSDYALIYTFETDGGNEYRIVFGKNRKEIRDPQGRLEPKPSDTELEYSVAFGVIPYSGVLDFEAELKDTRNLFRVMATIILAIKEALKRAEKPVTRLIIEPTKRDSRDKRRYNLYKTYIEKHMPPGWAVTKDDGDLIELERSI